VGFSRVDLSYFYSFSAEIAKKYRRRSSREWEGDDSGPNDLGKEGRGGEGATRSRPENDILVVVGGGPRESSDRTSRATLVREAVEIESSK